MDNAGSKSAKEHLKYMLKESHLDLLFAFVLVYAFVYLVFSSYAKHNSKQLTVSLSRLFDGSLLFVIAVFVTYYNWTAVTYTNTHLLDEFIKKTYTFYENPIMMFSTMIFICVFTGISFVLGIPTHGENTPFSVTIISHKGWYFLFSQVIFNILKFVFAVDLVRYLKDHQHYYNGKPKEENKQVEEEHTKEEVFHIHNNLYTYRDAKNICKSLDSRLATYEEIEAAYKKGGEWCSYGWSDDKLALFPTQSETWTRLQKNPKTKHMCGRPGINGGKIKNPNTKYGVNCFGVKPDESMKSKGIAPSSTAYLAQFEGNNESKVKAWKNIRQSLSVHSFNPTLWSSP